MCLQIRPERAMFTSTLSNNPRKNAYRVETEGYTPTNNTVVLNLGSKLSTAQQDQFSDANLHSGKRALGNLAAKTLFKARHAHRKYTFLMLLVWKSTDPKQARHYYYSKIYKR